MQCQLWHCLQKVTPSQRERSIEVLCELVQRSEIRTWIWVEDGEDVRSENSEEGNVLKVMIKQTWY